MKKEMTVRLRFLIVFILAGVAAPGARADQPGQESEPYGYYLKAVIEQNQGNLASADSYLEKALALAPESAYLHQAMADLSFRQNQIEKAATHVEKAIALDPDNIKMRILAGQIFWALGNQAQAEKHLKKAVELGPDEAEALVNLALAVTPKDPQRAIKLYKEYLERHPSEVEIQERLAQLYQNSGEVEKAKQIWTTVLDLDPESIRGHLASAQIAEIQHDTMTAIGHYEAVLVQDPSNLPLLLRIGELRYRNDEMAQAYDAFSKAQTIAPNSASANFWLALIAENRGDWNEAIRLLKSVAEKAPEPGVLLRLSFYYSQIGQRKEAIKLLEKLSTDEPENTDFLRYLSVAYEQDKQYQKSLTTVDKLIAIDLQNPDYHFQRASLLDRMGQFTAAEMALKTCIQMDPGFHMAMNYLGYSYAEKNVKLDEAEKLVNDAIALDPENSAYLDSMGWVYYRQGKFKKAEDFLTQAAEEGRDALIWDHLGDAQNAQVKFLEAISSWEMALRTDPTLSYSKKKIDTAIMKLTAAQRFKVYLDNCRGDFSSLASLKGLSKIGLCQKKKCFDINARFDYDRTGNLHVEVPGPMGMPLVMMVKSATSTAEFGSVDPRLLDVETYVVKAFTRLDSLLRGTVFSSSLEFADQAVRGGTLKAKSSDMEISFDAKSGALKEIIWGSAGVTERLTLKGRIKNSRPPVPNSFEWKDEVSQMSLRISLVKPVVQSTLAP